MTLVGIVAWAMLDVRFELFLNQMRGEVGWHTGSLAEVIKTMGFLRVVGITSAALVALVTLGMLFLRSLWTHSETKSRSIASLLSLTLIVAIWCSLAIHHTSLAWQGKRIRLAVEMQRLESVAELLRQDWPQQDGELPEIGPFMAYPLGRPTTLVLLQAPPVSGDSLWIAAIERRRDGALLLQLSGSHHDDWVQWHPPESRPSSFVGGLCDSHHMQSSAKLGYGWYLVRYQSSATATPSQSDLPLSTTRSLAKLD